MATPDPRGRAMLRAYRRDTKRSGEQREALWSRIEASLDAGAPGPSVEPVPRHAEPRAKVEPRSVHAAGWVTPVVVAAVAVAAAVVAVIGLGPGERRDVTRQPAPWAAPHEAAPREEAVEAPRSTVSADLPREAATASQGPAVAPRGDEGPRRDVAPSLAETSEPSAEVNDASSARRPTRPGAPKPHGSVPSPSSTEVDELRAEMALIREARQALQADRPKGALEVLDAHARAFPRGQMREDAAVLRIEALCAAGKAPQARAEVRLFLRAFPGSAHAQRMRATCSEP